MRAVEQKQFGNDDFHNVDGMPVWDVVARFCQQHRDRLHDKEREFINDMAAQTVWRKPTAKHKNGCVASSSDEAGNFDVL
jgi:hypothetical protein